MVIIIIFLLIFIILNIFFKIYEILLNMINLYKKKVSIFTI